jgi:hypothetical protein
MKCPLTLSLVAALASALAATAAPAPPPPKPKTFVCREGAFEVKVPSTPKEDAAEGAEPSTMKSFSGTLKADLEYTVMFFKLLKGAPPEGADKLLDDFVEAAAEGSKLIRKKEIKLGAAPGREAVIREADGKETLRMRLFVARGRLYLLGVKSTKGDVNGAEVTAFLDSFKLRAEH